MPLNFEKLSALVVEDTAPMRKLIVSVLECLGVGTIISAGDGAEGFRLFCRESPDIVIADWHMEPMDGISLTKEIRTNHLSTNRMVPVILVTGYNARSRIAMARDAGVTEFLVKPFAAHDLASRIAHVINRPRDFVDSPRYFGPDRRRRKSPDYEGPMRRNEDREKIDQTAATI